MRTPDHLRLQEESPVLRVRCTKINGHADKKDLLTTDTELQADVMKTLISLNVREVTRMAVIHLIRNRTGRYGCFRHFDDANDDYVDVTVLPDNVLRVRITRGEQTESTPVLQTELPNRLGEILSEASLPASFKSEVEKLLAEKGNFSEPFIHREGKDDGGIEVRIAYFGANDPQAEQSSNPMKGGFWRCPR